MKPHYATIALFAALAATVSLATGWWGSNNLLSAVPAILLVRYVLADFEGTLTAALICTAATALTGLAHSELHAVVAAVGGLVAAELATVGAAVRRRESTAGVRVLSAEAAANCGLAIAATAGTAAVALLHWPTWLSLTALIVIGIVVVAFAIRSMIQRDSSG